MRRSIPAPTTRQRAVITAAVLILASAACRQAQDPTVGDPPTATAPTPTADGPVGPTAGETSEEASERVTPDSQAESIEITVSGGEVDGPGTVAIDAGTDVELVVTSDVDDHVHVHGYDIFQDVTAGEPATLTFTADIPGVFEVELEDRGIHLVELQVGG